MSFLCHGYASVERGKPAETKGRLVIAFDTTLLLVSKKKLGCDGKEKQSASKVGLRVMAAPKVPSFIPVSSTTSTNSGERARGRGQAIYRSPDALVNMSDE